MSASSTMSPGPSGGGKYLYRSMNLNDKEIVDNNVTLCRLHMITTLTLKHKSNNDHHRNFTTSSVSCI